MASAISEVLDAIQRSIVERPQRILNIEAATEKDRITVRDAVPFLLVKGELNSRNEIGRSIDLIVGFYAVRNVEFKVYYGDVLCEFQMTAGSFHFALDKRSMVPLTALIFNKVKIQTPDVPAIVVVGAILQPKLKYDLMINPSVWAGVGRTITVQHGTIRF